MEKMGVNRGMKTIAIAFISVFAWMTASCAYFSAETSVNIALPEIPAKMKARLGEPYYVIEYPDDRCGIRKAYAGAGAGSVSVTVPKTGIVPVLCTPCTERVSLFPGGCVISPETADTEQGGYAFSWELGFAADVLLSLVERGFDISAINARKLVDEIDSRAQGDPWALDRAKLMNGLVSGDFTVYCIDPLDVKTVVLSTLSGRWLPVNPLKQAVSANDDGTLQLENLTIGFHRFLNANNSGILDVSVKENETLWLLHE